MTTRPMHERIIRLQEQFRSGKATRREFIRGLVALGLSAGAAETLAACAGPSPATTPGSPPASTAAPAPGATPRVTALPEERYYPIEETGLYVCPYCGMIFDTFEELDLHGQEAHAVPRQATPTTVPTSTPAGSEEIVRQGSWLCDSCGQTFRTLDELQRHVVEAHSRRLPAIRRVDKPTYAAFLTDQVQRFDQKNTVFCRANWDVDYQKQMREAQAQAKPRPELETLEGAALAAGAIFVDANAGNLHPAYGGYSGHLHDIPGLYAWDGPVNPTRYPVTDPAQMSLRVKEIARLYGADLVGICRIDRRWVYSHYYERETGAYAQLDLPYTYAVVMAVEMDWSFIHGSPGFDASAATGLGYSRMPEVAGSLARYIRGLGYPALPSGNDTTQSIPLAIDAGLGELGRNGLLLTPQFGPRQRICKVYTDLPLEPDQPIDFGLQQFCEKCFMCAHSCPAQAIQRGERTTEQTSISNRPGIRRWPVNVTKCYLFWQRNGVDCSNCIASCPWAMHVQRDWVRPATG